jgi:hypothetical protein
VVFEVLIVANFALLSGIFPADSGMFDVVVTLQILVKNSGSTLRTLVSSFNESFVNFNG